MSSPHDRRRSFRRDYYATIRAAVATACVQYGAPVTREIRAVIGFFALLEARAGTLDIQALADAALRQARESPNVLGDDS